MIRYTFDDLFFLVLVLAQWVAEHERGHDLLRVFVEKFSEVRSSRELSQYELRERV